MAQILKLPGQPAKLGYKRVRKRCVPAENPNQLDLFEAPAARILPFTLGLSAFEQALALDEHGDPRAADLYQEAIEKGECISDALCNLGILETQRKNSIKAFDCFTRALQHDARHAEAHYNLGNLYFELNDFRLAQLHFDLAVDIDPEFANAFYNLALVQTIENNPSGAASALTRYQQLVSEAEASAAAETLEEVRRSIAILKQARSGASA
jgi:tetratricopeptide (TPR) repeat protein